MRSLPASFRRALLALALAVGPASSNVIGAQPAPGQPRVPAPASIRSAREAGDWLRHLYLYRAYADGVAMADSLAPRFGTDSRFRTWQVLLLSTRDRNPDMVRLSPPGDSTSRDPWRLVTRAFVQGNRMLDKKGALPGALRLVRRAMALRPDEPDFPWFAIRLYQAAGFYAEAVAFADSQARHRRAPEVAAAREYAALWDASWINLDTTARRVAFDALAAERRRPDAAFAAWFPTAEEMVRNNRLDEAIATMREAVERSPRANGVRSSYWDVLASNRADRDTARANAVRRDQDAFLAIMDSSPAALLTVAAARRRLFKQPARELEELILTRTGPRTGEGALIRLGRAQAWEDSLRVAFDSLIPPPKSDTATVRRAYVAALQAIVDDPAGIGPYRLAGTARTLYYFVKTDSGYPTERLLHLAALMRVDSLNPNSSHDDVPRTLAHRGVALALADSLARGCENLRALSFADSPKRAYDSEAQRVAARNGYLAPCHLAVGVVLRARGRLAESERYMLRALEDMARIPYAYHEYGLLQLAQGKPEAAEFTFAQGQPLPWFGPNPNTTELQRIYRARRGSLEGFDAYLTALADRERGERRTRTVAGRLERPKALPPFRLRTLDGRVVTLDSLRGKTVVINLWGTWCGPCVNELPQLQQFFDRHRGDSSVVVLTIAKDNNDDVVRNWLSRRKLTLPTIRDNDFAARVGVTAWPTTLFIDPAGNIQYKVIGSTTKLVEEWGWRLDDVRRRAGEASP